MEWASHSQVQVGQLRMSSDQLILVWRYCVPAQTPVVYLSAVLEDLGAKYPGISSRIFDGAGVRRFVNVYLNNEDIRYLENLATPVKDGDELAIIPAVAGG